MNVKIQDLKDVTINGVKTLCTKSLGSYKTGPSRTRWSSCKTQPKPQASMSSQPFRP